MMEGHRQVAAEEMVPSGPTCWWLEGCRVNSAEESGRVEALNMNVWEWLSVISCDKKERRNWCVVVAENMDST